MLPELVEARLELAQSVLRVWRTQEVPAWYRYSLSHNMNVLYYKLRHSASCLDPESDGDLYQRSRDFLDDFDNDERKSYYLTEFVSD